MKAKDQRMTIIEKIVCYSQYLRGGVMVYHARLHGKAPGLVRSQGQLGENVSKRLYCGFPGKRKGKAS